MVKQHMTSHTPITLSDNNIHTHAQRESVSGSTTLGGRGTIVKKFEPAGDPRVARIPPVTIRVTLPHNNIHARKLLWHNGLSALRHNNFRRLRFARKAICHNGVGVRIMLCFNGFRSGYAAPVRAV